MKCEHCGNIVFIKGTVIKRLSTCKSNWTRTLVPIEIYSCGNCGEVPKTMLKDVGLEGLQVNKNESMEL